MQAVPLPVFNHNHNHNHTVNLFLGVLFRPEPIMLKILPIILSRISLKILLFF